MVTLYKITTTERKSLIGPDTFAFALLQRNKTSYTGEVLFV